MVSAFGAESAAAAARRAEEEPAERKRREADRHHDFTCPIDGCDPGPFDDLSSWTDHMKSEHGVEGPL